MSFGLLALVPILATLVKTASIAGIAPRRAESAASASKNLFVALRRNPAGT